MRYIFTLLFIFQFITITYAQSLPPGSYSSTNKKAIALYEEGKKMLDIRNYEKAESKFKPNGTTCVDTVFNGSG